MKKSYKFYLGVLLFSIVISIPLLIPFFHSGFFPSHDGEWTVVRLADMFRLVKDFQIPPRYSGNLNFGYGYPLFNFAYPFPYYIALIVKMIGFGYVASIKTIFILSVPISAFFMFLASRSFWKSDYAGIVSSVLYLYFPYRLVDLYVRGSLGESVAFAIIPVILLSISKIIDNPKSKGYKILAGVMMGCLILSHNIMAVLFSVSLLIIFIAAFIIKKREVILPFIHFYFLGLVLSAFFWVPALYESKYIQLSVIPIADRTQYFVSVYDLFFSKWGYGIPTDPTTGFTYQIGWPFVGIMILIGITLAYVFYKKVKLNNQIILATVMFFGALIFGLLMFRSFEIFWNIPLLSEINFPWTVLSQMGVMISLLAGFLITYKMMRYLSIGFALLALVLYLPFAKPFEYVDRGDGFYFTNDATTTSSSEYTPLWVNEMPLERPLEKVIVLEGSGRIDDLFFNSKRIIFTGNFDKNSIVRVNTIYYPGWTANIDGESTSINYENEKGVMEISVSEGTHSVEFRFGETRIRLLANLISLVGIIYVGFVSWLIFYKKIRKKWKK